jgi:hypothetical protein
MNFLNIAYYALLAVHVLYCDNNETKRHLPFVVKQQNVIVYKISGLFSMR